MFGSIQIGDSEFSSEFVVEHLAPMLTEHRRTKLEQVVRDRTFGVVPVVENLYDRGNISAVMRSAEGLGFHSMHVIQTGSKFKESARVTKGADKWLKLINWKSTSECVSHLKSQGFKICVTTLDEAKPISQIDFVQPTAVVFGNEKDGASQEMLELADERMVIPMQGFTQSFNISVAAALTFYHVRLMRKNHYGEGSELDTKQQAWLLASYLAESVGSAEKILLRAQKNNQEN